MTYDHSKYENRLRASALLKDLKGKLVDVGVPTIEVRTMTAESSMAWWRLSKAAGVHVYHEGGGWQADVVFKDLPPGVPKIIGSPEIYPTRQAALAGAIDTLSIMAVTDKMLLPGTEDGYRWFKFDGMEIPIQADLIKDFPERLAAEGYTALQVRARLARLRHDLADDRPLTTKIFNALDPDDRNGIRIVCGIDPPPLNWSTLKYVFWQTGGPRCLRSATSPKRSSRSCARSMCWSRRGNPLPTRSARSA